MASIKQIVLPDGSTYDIKDIRMPDSFTSNTILIVDSNGNIVSSTPATLNGKLRVISSNSLYQGELKYNIVEIDYLGNANNVTASLGVDKSNAKLELTDGTDKLTCTESGILMTDGNTTVFSVGDTGQVKSNSLTASRALVSDANKNVVSSAATATELGYLHGVTSAIQTQLNNKVNTSVWDAQWEQVSSVYVDLYFIAIGSIKMLYIRDNFKTNIASGWTALVTSAIATKYRPIVDMFMTATLPDGTRATIRVNANGTISIWLSAAKTSANTTRIVFTYI